MDGPRRHFDDIDGCGGPPVGELIALDAGSPRRGRRRLGRLPGGRGPGESGGGARPRRERGGSRGIGGGRGFTPSADRLPPDAGAPSPSVALTAGLVTTVLAGAAAWAIVRLVEADVFEGLVDDPGRRRAAPFVLAALAFELVAAAGLFVARRGRAGAPNPLRPPTHIGGDDLLRGGIAFLLALFAASVVTSGSGGQVTGWGATPASLDAMFLVEVLVVIVLAPVVEERLFRGLLLVGLRDRFGPVLGVLGSAAIGGAALSWVAAPGDAVTAALSAFAIGGVFGWFAHTTDDLQPSMLGHAAVAAWLLVTRLGI